MTARAAFWFGVLALVAAVPSSALAQNAAPPAAVRPVILPPEVAFGRQIAFIRGHLLTGDELVGERQWNAAYPHLRFPTEEVYGVIRDDLRTYKTPPFDGALKALARAARSHNAKQYRATRAKVEDALTAADTALKARRPDWPRFVAAVAVEVLKAATDEYEDAASETRILHPIGYQTARGFVLQADRMFESVAADIGARNAEALRDIRDGLAQLKQAFAAVSAPRKPAMQAAAVAALVAKVDLAARKIQ